MSGVAEAARREGRLPDGVADDGLRRHTARGTIVNAAFQTFLAVLLLARRLIVAAFLTPTEFGIWAALLGALLLFVFIKDVGIGDKFVQQSEPDQERAFQKMLTIDLLLAGATVALAVILLPVFALLYGHASIIAPGLILSLAVIGNSLQAPAFIYYRRMDFVRQRSLQAVDPVVAFVVTVVLAIGGAGYWSLVIGAVAGAFTGAAVALVVCPYRLALHLERRTVHEYFRFSWPLAVANGGGVAIGNLTVLIATRTIGFAAAGSIGLANGITNFSDGVDAIVTQTLYPAICAVRERADLLYEAFVKSNRLALMWGMPFGIGIALFAGDLVHFVLGDRWAPAIPALRAFGIVAATDQIAFNWTAFLRALDYTRPLATIAILQVVSFAVVTVPLLIAFGIKGFAIGVLVAQVVNLAGRTYFLGDLFARFDILRHALRAALPMVPAVAVVLAARATGSGTRDAATALSELAAFLIVSVTATAVIEESLLREVLGYVGRRTAARPA